MLNERLARHYGIPNIYGSQFRRVQITDEGRRYVADNQAALDSAMSRMAMAARAASGEMP